MIATSHLEFLIILVLKTAQFNYTGDKAIYSKSAVSLLLGTAAQESKMGLYLKQIKGPAKGIFQIEPATEKSIWEDYIAYRPKIKQMLENMGIEYCNGDMGECNLTGNIVYQIILARLKYLWAPGKLPHYEDVNGLGEYWKRNYNTYSGRGTVEEFVTNYNKYVLE